MLHLDLFSGIGGFAYAADQVWPRIEHIFCDNDKFCQQVLKKHWPESEIYGDIRQIVADPTSQGLERGEKPERLQSDRRGGRTEGVFLLTGGFPCQPFSAAGLRKGTADERHLWPEMLRIIRLTKPRWVIAENVYGLLTWDNGVQFEQVCADLEALGYEVQPFVIPAASVGAPHKRDRIWICAHADSNQHRDKGQGSATNEADGLQSKDKQTLRTRKPSGTSGYATNSPGSRPPQSQSEVHKGEQKAVGQGCAYPDWGRNWTAVAAELCSVDDGLPYGLGGFELTKSAHRKEQLKAYGNAIVPQVAIEIMKAMKEADHA